MLKRLPVIILIVLISCSRQTTRLDLYWPYELWDGMNRMVFALNELGYEIYSVDTENGTIIARKWPQADERRTLSGPHYRGTYELQIDFPADPQMPILIRQIQPEYEPMGMGEKDLQKIINTIAWKFQQFGGVVVEVKPGS